MTGFGPRREVARQESPSLPCYSEANPPAWWREVWNRARSAAKRRGEPFELTASECRAIAAASGGVCQVSGMPFSNERVPTSRKRPFAPSLDRIDCSRGYEAGNCRVVCVLVNLALNDFGLGPLLQVARGIARNADAARANEAAALQVIPDGYAAPGEYLREVGARPTLATALANRTARVCDDVGRWWKRVPNKYGKKRKVYPRECLELAWAEMQDTR